MEIDEIVGKAMKARWLVHRIGLQHLCKLAQQAPDGTGVEIGIYQGSSLIAWALTREGRGEAIGIDNWEYTAGTPNLREKCLHNIEISGAVVTVLDMDSEQAAGIVPGPISFAFIDGNHTRDYVRQDIELWTPKVVSGGIVAFHDYGVGRSDIHVKEVVDEWQKRDQWLYLGEASTVIGFRKP